MKQRQSDVTAWRYVYRGFDTEKKWKATGEGRPIRQVSDAVFKKTDLHSDKEISGVKTHFYFFKKIKKSIALNAGQIALSILLIFNNKKQKIIIYKKRLIHMAISMFNVIFLTALSLSGLCRFFYTEIRKNNVSFNKTVLALSFTTSALFCHTAMAGTDINVHGVIAPNACTANVVGGEGLDWGITQHENLNQTAVNTFTAKQVTLQVSCPSAQKVAFWATDPNESSAMVGVNTNNRSGHADSTRIFGLGMDPVTGNKLGNFTLSPVSSTVDGVTNTTSFGYQNSGSHSGTAFGRVLNADWSYKKTEDWTPWDETTSAPASGKVISWVFDVEPQLNAGNMITNAQQVDWQGTAQINVRYF